jgi:hypothetical protein
MVVSHRSVEYARPGTPLAIGLGQGEALSASAVWLPKQADHEKSKQVRLIILNLSGGILAETEAVLSPFQGVVLEYMPASDERRQYVFAYVFVDAPLDEVFAGSEVYEPGSGRSTRGAPIGIG